MSDNVKIAVVSGIVSVIVALFSTIGVIYSKSSDLSEAYSDADSASKEAKKLRDDLAGPNLPRGAVVAFRLADCPTGWKSYELAKGRVLIGSGTGEGLTSRTLEEIGGEESSVLKEQHTPPHKHKYDDWHYYDQVTRHKDYATKEGDDTGNIVRKERISKEAGQGEPHNNMQPYVTLLYCKKA